MSHNDPNLPYQSIRDTVYNLTIVVGIERNHVLRKMSADDIQAAFKAYEYGQRQDWERTRILAYHVIAPHLKGSQTIQNFMPLPWDNEGKVEVTAPTRADFERLKKLHNLT